MPRDLIIQAGIQFNPKDVDTRAIRDAITKTLANTQLSLSKVRFSSDVRRTLQDSFSKITFSIDKASIGSSARAKLQENFGAIHFVVQNARFGAQAIAGLKGSLSNIQVSLNQVRLAGGAQKAVQSAAAGTAGPSPITANATNALAAASKTASQRFKDQNVKLLDIVNNTTAADRATQNYLRSIIQTAGSAETFGQKIGQITTRFSAYIIALKAVLLAQEAFNSSLKFIFDFDAALQDLQKVINTTPAGLESISASLFNIANNTGKSVTAAAAALNEFFRAGLGTEEALKRTEAALVGVNVTGLSVEESTKLITSALTVFKDELKDGISVIDLLTVADVKAAASAQEIARGILRSGAAAESVGVSFKELNAVTAATIEATQLSGSTIGAALKTIFANLAGNSQQLREQANAFGANINAGDSFFEILKKLSIIFPRLGTEQIAVLNQLLAGKRRFTELTGLLGNFGKALQIVEAENTATGTALERNNIELQKLSTQTQLTATAFQELIANVTGIGRGEEGIGSIRDLLKSALGVARDLATALNFVITTIKGAQGDVFSLDSAFKALIKAAIFTKGIDIIKGIIVGFKSFIFQSNSLTLSLNQNTKALLQQNSAITQQVSATAGVVQQQRAALAIEQRRLAIEKEIAGLQVKGGGASRQSSAGNAAKGLVDSVKPVLAGALLIGAQESADALKKLAKQAEEVNGFASKLESSLEFAAANGIELGATFALMFGVSKGLIAGLASASFSILNFALGAEASAQKFLKDTEKISARTLKLSDAQELFGERFGRSALQAVTGLEKVGNSAAGFGTILERVFTQQADASDNLQDQSIKLAQALEKVRGEVLGGIRAADIKKQFEDTAKGFRERSAAIDLKIKFGDLGSEFAPVTKLISETKASLQEFVDPIKTSQDLFNGIAKANKVVQELTAGTTRETSKILQDNGLVSERLGEIITQQERLNKLAEASNKEFQEAFDSRLKLRDTLDAEKSKLEGLLAQAKSQKAEDLEIQNIQRQLSDVTQKRESLEKAVSSAKQSQKSIEEEIVKLEQKASEIATEDLKKITDIAKARQSIASETQLITQGIIAESAEFSRQVKLLEAQAARRTEISRLTILGGTLATRAIVEETASRLQSEEEIGKLREIQQKRIKFLIAEETAARAAKDNAEADRIKKVREEFEKASSQRIKEVSQEFNIKLKATLDDKAVENIKRIEDSLQQFRLNTIERVIEAEKQAAQKRIDAVKQIGETTAGKEFLQRQFKPAPEDVRTFGFVGSIIAENLEQGTDTAVKGMLQKLDQLRVGGLNSFEDLRSATEKQKEAAAELDGLVRRGANATKIQEAKTKLEQANATVLKLANSGADAFEILAATQQNQLDLIRLNEEEVGAKRQLILDNLKASSERVNAAEQSLVEARNKIPPLNAQVIESEKEVAAANAEVSVASQELQKAYQAVADAQFKLNSEIAIAEFRAKQATGSFHGTGEQIAFLQNTLFQLNTSIKASAETILEVRRQILQEELNLLQGQFNTVKSLALEAATGGPEVAARITQQIAAAQEISRGASISEFSPDLIQGIERLFGVIDGLEQAVTEQGLASLGLSENTLDNMGVSIVELSKQIAETGKTQVDQAVEQVRLAQENLLKAEEQKIIAQQQLELTRGNREIALRGVSASSESLGILRFGFRDTLNNSIKQLSRLEDLRETINNAQDANIKVLQESVNQITELKAISEKQLGVLSSISRLSVPTTGGGVTTAAGGTLSAFEFFGLLKAARKEKRGMPSGSRLMLANTSEVVFTKKQAKMLGFAGRPMANAQTGNAEVVGGGQTEALTTALNTLMNKLNNPGFINQNISVQLDQQRRIDVSGLEGIESAVKNAFEQRMRTTASKDEQTAIADVVSSIVGRLSELGIVNSQGS